jgi:hypothetical protein
MNNHSALYTLKGGDYIMNKLEGVGRLNGVSSGNVSSPVAASKLIKHKLWSV